MKILKNKKILDDLIEKYKIHSYFNSENLKFSLLSYEKGEFLIESEVEVPYIMFVVEGAVTVYIIREDGTQYTIAENKDFVVLGDVEFVTGDFSPFFIEVIKPVKVIALSIEENRKILKSDTKFLNFLLEAFAKKMKWLVKYDPYSVSLEDKLLHYIQTSCPDMILTKIEKTSKLLHCSRRQLQRVLKNLTEKNILTKEGKGIYRADLSELKKFLN